LTPGQRLKALREAKGLNRNQLYNRVLQQGDDISSTYIPKLEKDVRRCSERAGIQYFKMLARALEVRDFVLTSDHRDRDFARNPEIVLAEEVLEAYLARPDTTVERSEAELLRRLVGRVGGPQWADEWPQLYRVLSAHRELLSEASRQPGANVNTNP
jgi:transcriptional regulator with XRE-family HTH domain